MTQSKAVEEPAKQPPMQAESPSSEKNAIVSNQPVRVPVSNLPTPCLVKTAIRDKY